MEWIKRFKIKYPIRIWALSLLLLLPVEFFGQEDSINTPVSDTLELNLNKALEIALSENPIILIAQKEVKRVDYARKEAWSSLFPSISAEGSYNRNLSLPVIFLPENDDPDAPPSPFGGGGAMKIGSKNSFSAALSASVPLFSYSIYQNIKISEHDVRASYESARASRLNMQAEVRNAYFTLLLANDSYEVMNRSMKNAEANLKDVKNLFSQGLVAEYDVIRSEVQVRNLRPSLVQAENGVRLSEMMIRVLLGIDQEVPIKVEEQLFDFQADESFMKESKNFNLSENTDLKQLDLQLAKMNSQFKLTQSQRYPMLAAFGNYQFTSQANDFKFSDYRWAKPFMVGLQLQIPIFNGFSIHHQEKQVRIGMDQMSLQREYTERNLTLQV
ncbi:MAG TPA: TolC family protein, partial [Marinilabiliaceae bacterium]|nr:TolC family protein [Marinilabiliaceae bacterium]